MTPSRDRLPAKFGDRGPKIVEITGETVDPLGNVHTGTQQVWEIDGARYPTIGLNAVAGKPKEEIGLEPVRFDDMRAGCYDIDERIKDMDQDGVHAQLCFPSLPGFAGSTFFDMRGQGARACVRPGVERLRHRRVVRRRTRVARSRWPSSPTGTPT